MSFGDKMKKVEADPVSDLEKTVAISFHATGEGVDKIDFFDWLLRASDADTPFIITHGSIQYYYTEKKDKTD